MCAVNLIHLSLGWKQLLVDMHPSAGIGAGLPACWCALQAGEVYGGKTGEADSSTP